MIKSSRNPVIDEAFDEFEKRYFVISIRGSQLPPIPVEKIVTGKADALFAALANAGYDQVFNPQVRATVLSNIAGHISKNGSPRRVVTRVGWTAGAYVLAHETIGRHKCIVRNFDELDPATLAKYRSHGTLVQWQKIAHLCCGNTRLMFSVALAFTGPILRLVAGPKAGGFQIFGRPESGKTTAAMAAGSVWGCHRSEGRKDKGFAESWNSTVNKIEQTALAHNDGLLILDETRSAGKDSRERAQVIAKATFALAEQTEKARLNSQQSVRAWRCYFFSTSNHSLPELGTAGGVEFDEAARGRLVDIPLPDDGHGLFEDLHGYASGEKLADALQALCRRFYGTPITEFIRRVVEERRRDKSTIKWLLEDERERYQRALLRRLRRFPAKPLNRATGRFATVFAAGSLAIQYGILPWQRKDLLHAILACQLDGLSDDQRQPASNNDPRTKLVGYIEEHHGQFISLDTPELPRYGIDKLDDAPGYRATDKTGQRWFYIPPSKLDQLVTGYECLQLKRQLSAEGLLARRSGRFVIERHIFRGGKGKQNFARVYAIKAELLNSSKAA